MRRVNNRDEIDDIWAQSKIPVIYRTKERGKKHSLRLPFSASNRQWLKDGRKNDPEWSQHYKCWFIPKNWFNDFVNRSLDRYGKVFIIQPFRLEEKCSRSCREAKGHECECSCEGANHGMGDDGSWFDIAEHFSIRHGPKQLACRLLRKLSDMPQN